MRKGFTLLEVVVSLAIFGVGMAGLLAMFTGSLRLAGGSRDVHAATVYASQRLEEALAAPDPAEGEEHGPFGGKYRWVMRTTFLPADGAPGLYRPVRFDVAVRWGDPGAEASVEMAATRWDKAGPRAPGSGG